MRLSGTPSKVVQMRVQHILALSLLFACGDKGDEDFNTEPTITFGVDTADSSAPPLDLTGQVGSIALIEYGATADFEAGNYAVGLFSAENGGITNLASCLLFSGLCTDVIPALGQSAVPVPNFDFMNSVYFYDVGDITAGDTTLSLDTGYQDNVFTGFPVSMGTGNAGISLDGDYLPYAGADDFAYATSLVTTSPDPLSKITVLPGEMLNIEWTAGDSGDMLLYAGDTLYHIEDNGSYSLDIDALGLRAPLDNTTVILSRETNTTVDATGNAIDVQTTSQQWFSLSYEDTEGWDELIVGANFAANCTDAAALGSISSGQYYGDVALLENSHDLGDYNPTTDWATIGNDGVAKVQLLAGQTLTASYTQTVYDAAIYLLDESCDADNPTAGVDITFDAEEEVLEYTATDAITLFLVMDAWMEGSTFSMVLDIQ